MKAPIKQLSMELNAQPTRAFQPPPKQTSSFILSKNNQMKNNQMKNNQMKNNQMKNNRLLHIAVQQHNQQQIIRQNMINNQQQIIISNHNRKIARNRYMAINRADDENNTNVCVESVPIVESEEPIVESEEEPIVESEEPIVESEEEPIVESEEEPIVESEEVREGVIIELEEVREGVIIEFEEVSEGVISEEPIAQVLVSTEPGIFYNNTYYKYHLSENKTSQ
jgi:hypothetical protein